MLLTERNGEEPIVTAGPDGIAHDAPERAEPISIVRLTHDGANVDPWFTSDGERIGFISDRTGAPSLWSMAADGSDQRPLDLAVQY